MEILLIVENRTLDIDGMICEYLNKHGHNAKVYCWRTHGFKEGLINYKDGEVEPHVVCKILHTQLLILHFGTSVPFKRSCEIIRDCKKYTKVKVLVMTGTFDIIKHTEMDGILERPVGIKELMTAINNVSKKDN